MIKDLKQIRDLLKSKTSLPFLLHGELYILVNNKEDYKVYKIDVDLDNEIYAEIYTKLISANDLDLATFGYKNIAHYLECILKQKYSYNPESLNKREYLVAYNSDIPPRFKEAWKQNNIKCQKITHKKYKVLFLFVYHNWIEYMV